jgi:hypothetical protein
MRFQGELRFESIREFEPTIDFGTIKSDKHTGEAIERQAGLMYGIPAGSLAWK